MYVPDHTPLGKGIENKKGGLATVDRIQKGFYKGKTQHWICVTELNNTGCYEMPWEGYLDEIQGDLKKHFGSQRAHCKPDTRPEANTRVEYYRAP